MTGYRGYDIEGRAYLSTHVAPRMKQAAVEAAFERHESASEFIRVAVAEKLYSLTTEREPVAA